MKSRISINRIFIYVYILIFIVSILIFSYVSYFLYNNFYKTITQSDDVIVLSQEVAIEDINMNQFKNIIDKIEKKTEEKELDVKLRF